MNWSRVGSISIIRAICTRTVFIADDDAAVRESLQVLLEAAGLRTRVFGSAGEILRCSRMMTAGCLLLDVYMPNHDGFEMLILLRRAGVALPAIFMTGEIDGAVQARAAKLNAYAVLQKPLGETRLLKAVTAAMRIGQPRPDENWGSRLRDFP